MAWEQHGGTCYFYSVRRAEGRVVRDYLGSGVEAHLAAALVEERRRRQQEDLRARRDAQRNWEAASCPVDALIELTDLLCRAALLNAGFHLHKSEWRKKRGRDR